MICINEQIDLEKDFEKIIVGKPVYSGIDYYKSDCGLVIVVVELVETTD